MNTKPTDDYIDADVEAPEKPVQADPDPQATEPPQGPQRPPAGSAGQQIATADDMAAPGTQKMSARDIQIGHGGVNFSNAAEASGYARMMATATLLRDGFRGEPGNCLMLVEDSIRFGIPPLTLARHAYCVRASNGTVSLGYESRFFAALIIRYALSGRPKYAYEGKGMEMVCICTVVAADDGEIIEHRSPPLGQINPRNSPLWKTDPHQQLAYYTVRALARVHFPHILMGLFDIEELSIDRPAMNVTPETSGLAARLQGKPEGGFHANTVDDLDGVVK